MNFKLFSVLFLIVALSACAGDYTKIFNGNDLTGWHSIDDGDWSVDKGELVCESIDGDNVGYLSTTEFYDNFDLVFEFKEEQMDGDFGVLFHTNVDTAVVHGWKVVIAPMNHGTGSIFEENGRGLLERIPEQSEKVLKPGDWNKMRIKVERGHVTTWLNDYLMVDYSDSNIAKGKGGIIFKVGKGKGVIVRLRNIKIKKLDELEKVNQYI